MRLAYFAFIFFFTGVAYAEEVVVQDQGFEDLVAFMKQEWHPGSFCMECHATLFSPEKLRSFTCSGCHGNRYIQGQRLFKINISKVSELHGARPCIRCHIGSMPLKEGLHDWHTERGVECSQCHVLREETPLELNISIPPSPECFTCHERNIHTAHGDKLTMVCGYCHGKEFASRYAEEEPVKINATKIKEEKPGAIRFPTLKELLFRILSIIF